MKAQTIKEVLVAARWLIANKGWCQGSYFVDKDWQPYFDIEGLLKGKHTFGGCCLSGAFLLVEADDKIKDTAEEYLENLIIRLGYSQTLVGFNDDPSTTKQDVLDVIGQAIDSLS